MMRILNVENQHLLHHFYLEHHLWIFSFLRKRVRCSNQAADLTHDTFLKLMLKDNLAAVTQPRAYITHVAHGVMVNHVRRKEIEKAYLDCISHQSELECYSPENKAIILETLFQVDEMLDGLNVKVKKAFLLAQLEGLSHSEIAKQMHVSVSSIRKYIATALLHTLRYKS
jgi:RNA polymerase sigma-70 factor (ECF subfamily)